MAGHARRELPSVADHHAVARQTIGVFKQELIESVAADLFLALDEKLQIHRQPTLDGNPGLRALDVGEHLPLVVGGAAGVEVAVATGRLERSGRPLLQRIGRLYIVVAVDQGRRGAGHGGRLGKHQRMAGGRNDLGRKPHPAELVGHPFRRAMHVAATLGIGADAGNPKKLTQFLLEPRRVRFQVLVDGGHGSRLSCLGWKTPKALV